MSSTASCWYRRHFLRQSALVAGKMFPQAAQAEFALITRSMYCTVNVSALDNVVIQAFPTSEMQHHPVSTGHAGNMYTACSRSFWSRHLHSSGCCRQLAQRGRGALGIMKKVENCTGYIQGKYCWRCSSNFAAVQSVLNTLLQTIIYTVPFCECLLHYAGVQIIPDDDRRSPRCAPSSASHSTKPLIQGIFAQFNRPMMQCDAEMHASWGQRYQSSLTRSRQLLDSSSASLLDDFSVTWVVGASAD